MYFEEMGIEIPVVNKGKLLRIRVSFMYFEEMGIEIPVVNKGKLLRTRVRIGS
jgi:hypothetical protein